MIYMNSIVIQPVELGITLYNRDSINLDLVLRTSSSSFVSLPSGAASITWKSEVRNSSGSVVANFVVTPSATNLTNGALNLYLAPTALDMQTGLKYDLQVSYTASSKVFNNTYLNGDITIIKDVTQ